MVYAAALPPSLKLMLIILDDFSGTNAECWPSMGTLAAGARVSRRHAGRLLAKLESLGIVVRLPAARDDGGQTSNRYQIDYAKVAALGLDTDHPIADEDAPPHDAHVGGGMTPVSRGDDAQVRGGSDAHVRGPLTPMSGGSPRIRIEPPSEPPVLNQPQSSSTTSASGEVVEADAVKAPVRSFLPDRWTVTIEDRKAITKAAAWRSAPGPSDLMWVNDALAAIDRAAGAGEVQLDPGERLVEFLIRRARAYGQSHRCKSGYAATLKKFLKDGYALDPDAKWVEIESAPKSNGAARVDRAAIDEAKARRAKALGA